MFLEVLGIIFLVVILVIGFFGWKFYRYVNSESNSDISVAISVLPSQLMELEPSNQEEWKEKERLVNIERDLKKVAADHVGYFCVHSGYAIIRISIWSFKGQAVAVIYEACTEQDEENVSFIFEVACQLGSGSQCITSNPHAIYESRPDNHRINFNESASILDFLKALKTEIPAGEKIQKISDSKQFFMDCYYDTTEWSWREAQLTSDKTQQVLSSVGVNVTDDLMETLVDFGRTFSIDVNTYRVRRQLAKSSTMSIERWEKIRDKLVFVSEQMQVDHIVDVIYDIAGELTETQEKVLAGFENNTDDLVDAISAFQMLVQSMNIKIRRVAKVDEPIKTEVYISLST